MISEGKTTGCSTRGPAFIPAGPGGGAAAKAGGRSGGGAGNGPTGPGRLDTDKVVRSSSCSGGSSLRV
jgi:hypothetical protein